MDLNQQKVDTSNLDLSQVAAKIQEVLISERHVLIAIRIGDDKFFPKGIDEEISLLNDLRSAISIEFRIPYDTWSDQTVVWAFSLEKFSGPQLRLF